MIEPVLLEAAGINKSYAGVQALRDVSFSLKSGDRLPLSYLFLFLGAEPCTDWLDNAIRRDEHGFILTSAAAGADKLLETSVPGILAAGDVEYTAYTSAFILFQLPHAIFAVSIMTALLPALSSRWAHRRHHRLA